MKTSIHRKILLAALIVLVGCIVTLLGVIIYQRHIVAVNAAMVKGKVAHNYDGCQENRFLQYPIDETFGSAYQLLVLCGEYIIESDPTVAIVVDQVFLKDVEHNKYYGLMPYESPVKSGYRIEAIHFPQFFIRACWEGCRAPVMVELNRGPNAPEHYFDLKEIFYRNDVNDYLDIINGKVIVAGERKIAEFDPITFNIKTLYTVKEGESIGYSNSFPIFVSSVTLKDLTHIEFGVYKTGTELTTDENGNTIEPKAEYTKVLQIK